MNSRNFICIICPNGCNIETIYENETIIKISGAKCKRGENYVKQEIINPKRTIATTVKIENAELPLCSVRLTKPVPKKDIFKVMEEINKVCLTAPVCIGKVVIHNVCGLDSDVIVTKDMGEIINKNSN